MLSTKPDSGIERTEAKEPQLIVEEVRVSCQELVNSASGHLGIQHRVKLLNILVETLRCQTGDKRIDIIRFFVLIADPAVRKPIAVDDS